MSDAEKSQKLSEEIAKRPNYFAGQYLLEEDFKSEQNYHIERQRHHNRLLHVSGIAKGLTVSNNQGLTVKVAAGTAFDSQGRQIILLYEKAVDLEEANNKNSISDGEYTLSIRYSEELTDKQGDDDFTTTRVQEKPEFVLSSSSAKHDETISLAKLTIKDKKVTIDQNVREYSGINLPTEDGKGVTLRAHVGVPNQAMLEGSLSISGGLTVLGETHIKGSLKVQGDLHIVQSLQIGDAPESQSVNRIVNEIREGTKDKADDKALITVKAAVDLADTKARKNGNSNEDFTAAHLRVSTLTINQKDVTAICDEINEEEEKENETAIPTIAAVKKYMESLLPPVVVNGVQMTYRKEKGIEKIEVTWHGKNKKQELNIPIMLRERIIIIPKGREMSDLTLMCMEEGWKEKVEIKKLEYCWECTVKGGSEVNGEVLPWEEKEAKQLNEVVKTMTDWKKEARLWWEEEARKLIEKPEYVEVKYKEEEGWRWERKPTVIDWILHWLQTRVYKQRTDDGKGYKEEIKKFKDIKNDEGKEKNTKIWVTVEVYNYETKNKYDKVAMIHEPYAQYVKEGAENDRQAILVIPQVWKALIVEKKGS